MNNFFFSFSNFNSFFFRFFFSINFLVARTHHWPCRGQSFNIKSTKTDEKYINEMTNLLYFSHSRWTNLCDLPKKWAQKLILIRNSHLSFSFESYIYSQWFFNKIDDPKLYGIYDLITLIRTSAHITPLYIDFNEPNKLTICWTIHFRSLEIFLLFINVIVRSIVSTLELPASPTDRSSCWNNSNGHFAFMPHFGKIQFRKIRWQQ